MIKEIKNFIKKAKHEKLSKEERDFLRFNISEFISFNPIRGKSPRLAERNYISIFEVRYFIKATALVLIFAVIAGGSGVSYAASGSLPGEKLYTIKVNVNEKIESNLAFTTEAKVNLASKQVERRLEETQVLVKNHKLSTDAQKIVEQKLDEHIQDLTEDMTELKEDGKVETILETTAKLTPVLDAHKKILEEKNADATTLVAKVEDSIKAVQAQEDEIIKNVKDEIEPEDKSNTTSEENPLPEEDISAASELTENSDKVEDQQKIEEDKAVKETQDKLDELNEQIEKIIKVRIEKTKDRLEEVKKNVESQTEKIEKITEEETLKTEENSNLEAINVEIKTATKIEVTPVTTTTQFNVEEKIKEAEDLIREAKDYFEKGRLKDALSKSQEATKIISEIEVNQKLKSLELAKITIEENSQKAEVLQIKR